MIERAHLHLSPVLQPQFLVQHWQRAMTANKDTQTHSPLTPFTFFVCGLFNDVVNNAYYTALNDRMSMFLWVVNSTLFRR
jgi:hypothetical protein